ncbi:MAG: hypothetical protein WKF94_11055 [Solirubrobacteraceae bacterium]
MLERFVDMLRDQMGDDDSMPSGRSGRGRAANGVGAVGRPVSRLVVARRLRPSRVVSGMSQLSRCPAIVGWIGVAATGSDTSSNALFGTL